MTYAGITIGPIIDTLAMTSTPGGLWFASYFFSSLMKSIIAEGQIKELEVLTLPEGKKVNYDEPDKGIGTFHDRVYFKSACDDVRAVESVIRNLINEAVTLKAIELAEALIKDQKDVKTYLEKYLQIHFIIVDKEAVKKKGIAKTLADALDALELAQRITADNGEDFLRTIIRGTEAGGSNIYIKKHAFYQRASKPDPEEFKLRQSGCDKIRDLVSIASNGRYTSEDIEKNNVRLTGTERYFAIVQCDGDNMGKLIAGSSGEISDQESAIRSFSEYCMTYTEKATARISDYGGVVVYAGGDDLLFLAPVVNTKNENIWALCRDIGIIFDEEFPDFTNKDGKLDKPSLSAGVSINYYKFPLYEAFEDARGLLFGMAKETGKKNNIAVKLGKASGQTCGFVCPLGTKFAGNSQSADCLKGYLELVDQFYGSESEKKDKLVQSVLYNLEEQKFLFELAIGDRKMIEMALNNTYDNAGQTFAKPMLEEIADLSQTISEGVDAGTVKGFSDSEQGQKDYRKVLALTSMLRMARFLVEER